MKFKPGISPIQKKNKNVARQLSVEKQLYKIKSTVLDMTSCH